MSIYEKRQRKMERDRAKAQYEHDYKSRVRQDKGQQLATGYGDTRKITGASKVKKHIRKTGIVNRENPKFGFRHSDDPPGGHFPYPYKSAEPVKAIRINIGKRKRLGDY